MQRLVYGVSCYAMKILALRLQGILHCTPRPLSIRAKWDGGAKAIRLFVFCPQLFSPRENINTCFVSYDTVEADLTWRVQLLPLEKKSQGKRIILDLD